MHPAVDIAAMSTPAARVSTVEFTTPCLAARPLIQESTMRFSFVLVTLLSSCVGAVGEDPGGREKPTPDCKAPEIVEESITIRSDADFEQLPKGCWDLHAKLRVEGPNIASLAKLGQLKAVDDLEIVDTALKTIDTTLPLVTYGAATIVGNKQLTSLANISLENDAELTTAYTIRNNPLLATLGGFEYVKQVEGELRITDNPQLGDITLDELASVGGAITITNTGATRIDLGALKSVGRIEIASNSKLTAIDGIAAPVIEGDFILRDNAQLASLAGVGSVQRVDGILAIEGTRLANLDAFTGLQLIASSLSITNNTALATLGRMSRLSGIGSTVTITGNAALPYCLAHEVDHCVATGAVTVRDNKPDTQNATCACWCQ